MKTLIVLATVSRMFSPEVNTIEPTVNTFPLNCIYYNVYKAVIDNIGGKKLGAGLYPNGEPAELWVLPDKTWSIIMVKESEGKPVACFYMGGTDWEKTGE